MLKQNCIALYLSPSLGLPDTGIYFLSVPTEGVPADLLADVVVYLTPAKADGEYPGKVLSVTAPTWDAVRQAVELQRIEWAQAKALRDACENETRERCEREAVDRDIRTAKWRASAVEYLAGADIEISVSPIRETWLEGIDSDTTDVQKAEIIAVREEHCRRAVAKQAHEQAVQAAKQESVEQALYSLLFRYGTSNQVERFAAHVLSRHELESVITDGVLPLKLGDAHVFWPCIYNDVVHSPDCTSLGITVSFFEEDGDAAPMTDSQWAVSRSVRAAAREIPGAVVDIRKHVATLSCGCTLSDRLAVRVFLRFAEADLSIQRQYALD